METDLLRVRTETWSGGLGEIHPDAAVGIRSSRPGIPPDRSTTIPPENLRASWIEVENTAPGNLDERAGVRLVVRNSAGDPVRAGEIEARLRVMDGGREEAVLVFRVAAAGGMKDVLEIDGQAARILIPVTP